MGSGFYRFRRRLTVMALVRSLMFGASLGFSTFSVSLLIAKFTAVSFDMFLWSLIGCGLSLGLAALLFLCSLRSDKRVAQQLDAEVLDRERVQTMIAFRDDDSEIVLLQREDTERRLVAVRTGKAKTRGLLVAVLLLLCVTALTTFALILPAKEAPPPIEEETPIDEYDKSWLILSLNDLIDVVQKSLMTASARTDIVAELVKLRTVVVETDKESVMRAAAIEAIFAVDAIVDGVNVSEDIAAVLGHSTDAAIRSLSEAIASQSGTATKKQLTALLNALKAKEREEIIDAVADVNDELSAALRQSGGSDADELYRSFKALSDALAMIVDSMENASMSSITAGLTAAFSEHAGPVGEAMLTERDNSLTGATVVRELMEIFSITEADLEVETEEGDTIIGSGDESFAPPEDEDDDELLGDGGLGTGETLYGSNDLVYDPDRGEYVAYGEILNGYYARVLEMVSDGRLSPEEEAYINRYFSLLFSGQDPEDGKGNGK